jgi:hypothetical protein
MAFIEPITLTGIHARLETVAMVQHHARLITYTETEWPAVRRSLQFKLDR